MADRLNPTALEYLAYCRTTMKTMPLILRLEIVYKVLPYNFLKVLITKLLYHSYIVKLTLKLIVKFSCSCGWQAWSLSSWRRWPVVLL